MTKKIVNSVVITAAGRGERFGGDKLLMEIGDEMVLQKSVSAFLLPEVDEIIVVTSAEKLELYSELVKKWWPNETRIQVIDGQGEERWQSSLAGVRAAKGEIVAIHDGARPLVRREVIEESLVVAQQFRAAVVAARATDSIKLVDENGDNYEAMAREKVWQAQTPQTFSRQLILTAYEKALAANYQQMTDESELVTRFLHQKVRVVKSDSRNLKITFPFDLEIARLIANN